MQTMLTNQERTRKLRVMLGEAHRFGKEVVDAILFLCQYPDLDYRTVTFNGERATVSLRCDKDDSVLIVRITSENATGNTMRQPYRATMRVIESELPVEGKTKAMLVNGFQFVVRAN